jgi:hypothetical protein
MHMRLDLYSQENHSVSDNVLTFGAKTLRWMDWLMGNLLDVCNDVCIGESGISWGDI